MVCFSHKLQKLAQLFLITAIIQGAATNSQVQLSSTLHHGRFACPGQLVTFTCKTPGGALILAWSSNEYIGSGLQLELTKEDKEVNSSRHPTTRAVRVELNDSGIVESRLYLVASSASPSATVTCLNVGHSKSSISFEIPALPNTIQNVTVSKTTPLPQTSSCVVSAWWTTPNNSNETIIKHYIIDYSLGSFSTADGSTNYARLVMDDCEAMVNFTIWAIDVCDREGAKMSSYNDVTNWIPTTEAERNNSNANFSAVTCGQRGADGVERDCEKYKTRVGVVVGTILGPCGFLLGILLTTLLFLRRLRRKPNNGHLSSMSNQMSDSTGQQPNAENTQPPTTTPDPAQSSSTAEITSSDNPAPGPRVGNDFSDIQDDTDVDSPKESASLLNEGESIRIGQHGKKRNPKLGKASKSTSFPLPVKSSMKPLKRFKTVPHYEPVPTSPDDRMETPTSEDTQQ